MNTTKVLQTCLTEDERNRVALMAEKTGLSVSAFIRRLIKAAISRDK